jgi:hypothetical protein
LNTDDNIRLWRNSDALTPTRIVKKLRSHKKTDTTPAATTSDRRYRPPKATAIASAELNSVHFETVYCWKNWAPLDIKNDPIIAAINKGFLTDFRYEMYVLMGTAPLAMVSSMEVSFLVGGFVVEAAFVPSAATAVPFLALDTSNVSIVDFSLSLCITGTTSWSAT